MLSYMLKKQILEITSEKFQRNYISTVTIPKEDHQILLFLLISLQHKREIQNFDKFRSFPCFLSSPTLIVSGDFFTWKRLRLERRWGHGKALSAQPGNLWDRLRKIRVVVSSCVYDLNQNRGQKHQKNMPKKNFILVNRCKYERRHASLSIFCHHRKREPMKASIFGPPSQLSKTGL